MKLRLKKLSRVYLKVGALIGFLLLNYPNICNSQTKLPPVPYEGMQITYTITGAKIIREVNVPGIKWKRDLVITDLHSNSVLGISGLLNLDMADCSVTVTVGAGNKSVTKNYEITKQTPLDFTQQVKIPADARSAVIYINMCVLIRPTMEAKELTLFAVWDGK